MPVKDHPVTWITDNSPESRRFYEKKVPVEKTQDPDALRAALKDEDYRIRVLAVENKYFPVSLYRLALRDKNGFVRSAVARKENLPKDLFVVALKDENEKVARAAMMNDNFPEDLFALVLKRDSSLIIEGIKNEKIPAKLLPTVFKHKNEYVRMAAVEHPDFPDSLLEKALKDESEWVRNVAHNVSRRKQIKGNQTMSIEQKIEAAKERVKANEENPDELDELLEVVKRHFPSAKADPLIDGVNLGLEELDVGQVRSVLAILNDWPEANLAVSRRNLSIVLG